MEHDLERAESPWVSIRPSTGWVAVDFRELWQYRELLFFLIWRDIKVRYKQTALGAAWAVIQPFLTMVVFSLFFGRLAQVPSDGSPYPVFAYVALLPWNFFAGALERAGNSLVGNSQLLTKVYFPRLIIPLSATLSGLLDFAIAFLILIGMILYYGIIPTWAVATLPLFVLFALLTALSVGLWLSALNVQYRDVRYTLTFLIQLWLFASPVAYPTTLVPEQWRPLYGLNPMAGVIEGFRWALLGRETAPDPLLLVSAVVVVLSFVGGLYYFRRMEKTFADVV